MSAHCSRSRRRPSSFAMGGLFGAATSTPSRMSASRSTTATPEIFTIIGESGSGKTTLARMILGLEPPTQGEIRFRGEDVSHRRGGRARHGLHGRGAADLPESVRGVQSAEAGRPLSARRPRAASPARATTRPTMAADGRGAAARSACRLAEVTRRFPHELSGGQLQRVAIARALIPKPSLLIADEPVSMVDASLRMSIVNLFKTLRDDLRRLGHLHHPRPRHRLLHLRPHHHHAEGQGRGKRRARDGPRQPAASLHPAAEGIGALTVEPAGAASARRRHHPPQRRARSAGQPPVPGVTTEMHKAKLTFDRIRRHRRRPTADCSAPSSSISAAASMADSTSPAIRRRPRRAFAATCWSWCANSAPRSSAIPAAISSPATTGRMASARSRSRPQTAGPGLVHDRAEHVRHQRVHRLVPARGHRADAGGQPGYPGAGRCAQADRILQLSGRHRIVRPAQRARLGKAARRQILVSRQRDGRPVADGSEDRDRVWPRSRPRRRS